MCQEGEGAVFVCESQTSPAMKSESMGSRGKEGLGAAHG